MAEDKKAFIYGIRPEIGTYFYIGSTNQSIQSRFKQHIKQVSAGTHSNPHFSNTVNKIGIDKIYADELEVTTEGERFTCEYAWIDKLQTSGVRLTNIIKCLENDRQARPKGQVIVEFVERILLYLRCNEHRQTTDEHLTKFIHNSLPEALTKLAVEDIPWAYNYCGPEVPIKALQMILDQRSDYRRFGICTDLQVAESKALIHYV